MPNQFKSPTGCRGPSLIGMWLMDPMILDEIKNRALAYDLTWLAEFNQKAELELRSAAPISGKKTDKPYMMYGDTAVLELSGPITKYPTSYSKLMDGTSTLDTMHAGRQAVYQDPDVKSVALRIDTPGGQSPGLFDLVDDIREWSTVKPVVTHAEDYATSAGQLLSAAGARATASRATTMGSIGVKSYLHDASEKMAKEGIKVIPIMAGKLKGAGLPGAPITPEQIAYLEGQAAEMNNTFINSVATLRNLKADDIRSWEAASFLAPIAKERGLIDEVCRFEDALSYLQSHTNELMLQPKGGSRSKVFFPVTQQPAGSPARSTAMALTAQQIQQARAALPGAVNVSEAELEGFVLNFALNGQTSAASLQQEIATLKTKLPKGAVDPEIIASRRELAMERLDLAIEKGRIIESQKTFLVTALAADSMASVLLSPVSLGEGKTEQPFTLLMKVLEGNKPNGIVGELTPGNPAPKTEPGNPDDPAKKAKKLTLETFNKNRDAYGLAPLTLEEFTKLGL